MLFQCWPIVYDAGPTLKHHWFNDQNYNKMTDVCFMHCGRVQRLQDISWLAQCWTSVGYTGPTSNRTHGVSEITIPWMTRVTLDLLSQTVLVE